MAKPIMETSLDTSLYTFMKISIDETAPASVDAIGVLVRDHYRVERICTKTDNALKAIMDAHREEQASYYS